MLQAGLDVSTYFEVICCTAGSEDSLLAGKGMNAKPAGSSSQPQQKLPRVSCGAAGADPKARFCLQSIYFILLGSHLLHWGVSVSWAEYLALGFGSAENVKNKTETKNQGGGNAVWGNMEMESPVPSFRIVGRFLPLQCWRWHMRMTWGQEGSQGNLDLAFNIVSEWQHAHKDTCDNQYDQ